MSLLDALIEDELWMPAPVVGSAGPPDTREPRREIWICLRTDGGSQLIFGSGTEDDPYDGSSYSKFDEVMSTRIPKNATIRIGPGTFETRGGGGNGHTATGWVPKPAWRIIGSGMFVTTLKLVNANDRNNGVTIISAASVNGLEVSDMTLDCNIAGQPSTSVGGVSDGYCRAMVAGIDVIGEGIQVRRVRVINFGTQTSSFEYGQSPRSLECFPLYVVGASNVVDDCIVEQAGTNNARETTCISAVGGSLNVARNCLVNGQVDVGSGVRINNRFLQILNISYALESGNHVCTVTFGDKHYKQVNVPNASPMTPNSYVVIEGVVLLNGGISDGGNNPFNGYGRVLGIVSDTVLKYKMVSAPATYTSAVLLTATMGFMLQAFSIAGGTLNVMERNRILGCIRGGPYQDISSSYFQIARENYYRDVYGGAAVALASGYAVGYFQIEDNIIDVDIHPTGWLDAAPPAGIAIGAEAPLTPPRFTKVVIRRNIIRHTDDKPDTNYHANSTSVAVHLAGIEDDIDDCVLLL
jgi:hypothetical protein